MTSDFGENQRASILAEIQRIIVEALRNNDLIHPKALASIIATSFPDGDLTEAQIAAGIYEAAAEAGIRVAPPYTDLLRRQSESRQ